MLSGYYSLHGKSLDYIQPIRYLLLDIVQYGKQTVLKRQSVYVCKTSVLVEFWVGTVEEGSADVHLFETTIVCASADEKGSNVILRWLFNRKRMEEEGRLSILSIRKRGRVL